MENTYELLGINKQIASIAEEVEEEIKDIIKNVESIAMYNQAKVLNAFRKFNISQVHFGKTTGYGYSDIGRDTIEKVFAEIFHTEDALVRVQFVSGTHTIATALKALLLPGDEMLAITGRPYDTLCEVIGLVESPLSLKNYGVRYSQIDLIDKNRFNIDAIESYIREHKVKLIHIQRSRGYELRKALWISDIKEVIAAIRKIDSEVIIMVDNCYGEFTEEKEPTEVGADIVCGSLIKNMGGGLCEMGGYIAGKKELIARCAETLTCPGVGKECGATLGQNRNILQGVFMASTSVKNALHAAIFEAAFLSKLGFKVYPEIDEKRSDIVQTIQFPNEDKMVKFVQGIQKASPVDSGATPYPWDMPGYTDKVVMAAGTFIEGATIELSADGPIRPPYVVYLQGGLTYESAKLAVCIAVDNMLREE